MAREGVSYDEVERVCEQFARDDISPTWRKVRDELGTGNPSTLLRHIKTWKERQHAAFNTDVELPQSVVGVIKKAMLEAVDNATEKQEAALADSNEQLQESLKALASVEDQMKVLEQEKNTLLAQSEAKILELEKQLAASQRQADDLTVQNKALNNKLDEALRVQEIARTESAKAQMQVERADKATDKAEQRSEELRQEVDQMKAALTSAEKAAATAEAVANEQSKAIDRLDAELAEDKQALTTLQSRYDNLLSRYEEAAKTEAKVQEQDKQINRLETDILTHQRRYEDLLSKYEACTRLESATTARLAVLEAKNSQPVRPTDKPSKK
ncbi:DNA-binding protein [Spartinivicinus sp. A2-2]|uniref:DNA-binding protein n=1 Tax=Spartinivicinus poritis TaxID=2994640 RepID=A0ABT5UJN6_9GAMM|nr:DNA-binding protein [Spartinivicinus sp. A2-2]